MAPDWWESWDEWAESVVQGPPQIFWPNGRGNPPKCVGCLIEMDHETYFKTDFVCIQCDAEWETFPWQSSHGGSNV